MRELPRALKMNSAATAVTEETRLYRIGEVKPFVLRYWETEFPMLQPVKSPRGHRLYRPEDVDLVLKIKRLLYDEGFTIAGARRHLRELSGNGASGEFASIENLTHSTAELPATRLNRKLLLDLRDTLRSFLTLLEGK